MPTIRERRLQQLFAEGLDVYPSNLRGMAASPPARRVVPMHPRGGAAFVKWVKIEFPRLAAAAERAAGAPGQLGGLAAGEAVATTVTQQPSAIDKFVSTIQTLAPQYLQYRAQQDLLKVQLDRARQGLPPLDPSQYAPAVQLSVDPRMYSPAVDAIKQYALPAALVLAAFFIVPKLVGGRRR